MADNEGARDSGTHIASLVPTFDTRTMQQVVGMPRIVGPGPTRGDGGCESVRMSTVVLPIRPDPEGCQNPVPSRRCEVVLVQKSAESIPSRDLPTWGRREGRLGQGWRASAERPVRALAVVVLDEDAQDPLELARSENQ